MGCDVKIPDNAVTTDGFNPRTRVGCDTSNRCGKASGLFQSTHPCGVRQSIESVKAYYQSFNPRTRVGCDKRGLLYLIGLVVSIHAPVWGATAFRQFFFTSKGFQSTHPCGVRLKGITRLDGAEVSIHAPVWGATIQII